MPCTLCCARRCKARARAVRFDPANSAGGQKGAFSIIAPCNNHGFSWLSAADIEWEKDFEKIKAGSGPGDVIAELDLDLAAFGLDDDEGDDGVRHGGTGGDPAASLDDDVEEFIQYTTRERVSELRCGNRKLQDDIRALAYRHQWLLSDYLIEQAEELAKVKRRLQQRIELLNEESA